jgi:hypothetical protein
VEYDGIGAKTPAWEYMDGEGCRVCITVVSQCMWNETAVISLYTLTS